MIADPSTLLQAIAVLCLVAAGAFAVGAHACSLSPAASWRWSLANLLFATGALLNVARATAHQPWMFATADALELAGFAALLAGFRTFCRRPQGLRAALCVLGAAAASMALAYAERGLVWRLWIYCAVAAWLLGLAAWTAFTRLRDEFGLRAAVIAAPMALACALQLTRAAAGFSADAVATDALVPTSFNIAVMWVGFVIAIALNFAGAGFIGARQVARIHALTLTDPLTGALNRRALDALLERELGHRSRHGHPLAIIYFDLDHFKGLNDTEGHSAGDAALRHVATVASSLCREGDTLARVGGEEFCLVLPYSNLEGSCLMAERLRDMVETQPLSWAGRQIQLTASFGAASVDAEEPIGVQALLARADSAMYEAKRTGRNCVAAWDAGEPVHERAAPATSVEAALVQETC